MCVEFKMGRRTHVRECAKVIALSICVRVRVDACA